MEASEDNIYKEGRILNESEIRERLQKTPKIDVEEKLRNGYKKLDDYLKEHGLI